MPDLHTSAASSTDIFDVRPAIRDAIDDSIAKIVRIQDDEGPFTAERFERIERRTLEVCMELGRRLVKGVLEDRDSRLPDAVRRDGRVFRRRKATPKTIATLLGSAAYKRSRYRSCEAGASWVPVDDGLGLVHGHLTRPTARICVLTASHCPARDARGILAEIGGASPSAGTLQRVTRSMNAELEKLPSERRTRIRSAEDIPADARSLSVSLDGVMVSLTQGEDARGEGAWRRALRDDPDGADRVVRAIRYLRGTARTRTARKELDRELAFFRKNRRRMRCAALADKAMGIGSGVVEAANKVLVVQRMKRSGMR